MNYQIFTPLIPFVLGIILKTLLDFNFALFIVKFFHWIPVRTIFRMKIYKINGEWNQIWELEPETSEKYEAIDTRKSKVVLKQFGKYCYGEFRARNDEEYYLYGEITGKNIVGKWGDRINELGYFGAFELRIVNQNSLEGIWLGHSNTHPDIINSNKWIWNKQLN